jgi:hypothetical protein
VAKVLLPIPPSPCTACTTASPPPASAASKRGQVIAVTTMWPEHWRSYMEAARTRSGLDQKTDRSGTQLQARPQICT